MKGKEHMIIGTTATATMGFGFLLTGTEKDVNFLIPLIIGGVVGSYIPDIDSNKSKAGQIFNKLFVILLIALFIGYTLGLALNISDILFFIDKDNKTYSALILFSITTILSKLSPHRSFTHKWFGTLVFCYSIYSMENNYLTLGFIMGYILHIVTDRFSPKGKNLNFFQFKLPCTNAKNKFTISW